MAKQIKSTVVYVMNQDKGTYETEFDYVESDDKKVSDAHIALMAHVTDNSPIIHDTEYQLVNRETGESVLQYDDLTLDTNSEEETEAKREEIAMSPERWVTKVIVDFGDDAVLTMFACAANPEAAREMRDRYARKS